MWSCKTFIALMCIEWVVIDFKKGKNYMRTVILKITTALIAVSLTIASTIVSAQELNIPGFSGTVNTTITSGFTVRTSEQNCELNDGYNKQYSAADLNPITDSGLMGGLTAAGKYAAASTELQALYLNQTSKNKEGCSPTVRTDSYGNVAEGHINIGNVNTDDGKLNFLQGDVVDATQRFFTAVSGKLIVVLV